MILYNFVLIIKRHIRKQKGFLIYLFFLNYKPICNQNCIDIKIKYLKNYFNFKLNLNSSFYSYKVFSIAL